MTNKPPEMPTPIKPVTIYEGIGLLEIKEGFKPKGIIERIDYHFYKKKFEKDRGKNENKNP